MSTLQTRLHQRVTLTLTIRQAWGLWHAAGNSLAGDMSEAATICGDYTRARGAYEAHYKLRRAIADCLGEKDPSCTSAESGVTHILQPLDHTHTLCGLLERRLLDRVIDYGAWVVDDAETCVTCAARLEQFGLVPRG